MTIDVFHSLKGIGHVHTVSNFDPAHHRADVDGSAYWIAEHQSVGEVAVSACVGILKRVVVKKPVPAPIRDERVAPGASSDAAPIHGGYADG